MNANIFTQQLILALKAIDGRQSPHSTEYVFNYNIHGDVFQGYLYEDEINSYPLITVSLTNERLVRDQTRHTSSVLTYDVRGYVWDEDVEEAGEALSRDVEHVLSYVRGSSSEIHDVRLLEINTDRGLNAPIGMCKFEVQVWIMR